MIVPWQQIEPATLENLIREFVLREGTDYGDSEIPLASKVLQIQKQLQSGDAVVVFSELHESVDIQLKR
tara:strand:+ start:21 stop:227 length:207 start_codon:yes stop_codon:yes gene_type:complete